MDYLRLRRTRVVLGAFLLFALLISAFPTLDIQIARLFFGGGAFWNERWQTLLQGGLRYFLVTSFVAVALVYACNRLLKRNLFGIDGRRVIYLFGVAIIGAGLIVNVVFKDHFGRARPRDIAEFGGTKHFTPPFVVTHECRKNCSFSSGDAAGAFISIALARALTRRRRYLVAAVAFGTLVSFSRVAGGAHFFSDTVVSFFVMLIVADAFFYYVMSPARLTSPALTIHAGNV